MEVGGWQSEAVVAKDVGGRGWCVPSATLHPPGMPVPGVEAGEEGGRWVRESWGSGWWGRGSPLPAMFGLPVCWLFAAPPISPLLVGRWVGTRPAFARTGQSHAHPHTRIHTDTHTHAVTPMAAKQEGQMADLSAALFWRLCPFALLCVTRGCHRGGGGDWWCEGGLGGRSQE